MLQTNKIKLAANLLGFFRAQTRKKGWPQALNQYRLTLSD
jgi:hypothetical protein